MLPTPQGRCSYSATVSSGCADGRDEERCPPRESTSRRPSGEWPMARGDASSFAPPECRPPLSSALRSYRRLVVIGDVVACS